MYYVASKIIYNYGLLWHLLTLKFSISEADEFGKSVEFFSFYMYDLIHLSLPGVPNFHELMGS